MNKLTVLTINTMTEVYNFRLTNLQRFQALLTVGFFGGTLLMPHRVLAQLAGPLTNGAGNAGGGGQCGQSFWFMSSLYSFIAQAFTGLGGAGDFVCQMVNILFLVSLVAGVGMILWGMGDIHTNETPFKKAFSPFVGWLTGLILIYFIIGFAFFGSTVGGANGNAPGVI